MERFYRRQTETVDLLGTRGRLRLEKWFRSRGSELRKGLIPADSSQIEGRVSQMPFLGPAPEIPNNLGRTAKFPCGFAHIFMGFDNLALSSSGRSRRVEPSHSKQIALKTNPYVSPGNAISPSYPST